MTTCQVCDAEFDKSRMGQVVCGVKCAQRLPVVNRKAEKAAAKKTRAQLAALKPRKQWLAEAQVAFNAWVRARDVWMGCISCGTMAGKVNAGHYLSVGARPELRFEPLNVNRQCERCNTYLHGNLIAYRHALLRRIGAERVDWLEGPHEAKKHSIDELRQMIGEWRAETREALL